MKSKIALLFFLSGILFGSEVYIADKSLPQEFQFLIAAVGEYPPEKKLDVTIQNLDLAFQSMDKNSRDFLLKTEIIKWLLNHSKSQSSIESASIQNLQVGTKKFDQEQKELTSLAIWFIHSLHTDLEVLINSSHFPTLIQKIKKKMVIKDQQLHKLHRQLKILLPAYALYLELPAEEYKARQRDVVFSLLNHLENYTSYYLNLSSKNKISKADLKFFKKGPPPVKNNGGGVLAILEEVNLPKKDQKNKDEWRPRQDLALFPTPDPDYLAPRQLPKPVSDWSDEPKQIYPLVNPYYIAPKKLPIPIKNWVELTPPEPQASPDPDTDWILE